MVSLSCPFPSLQSKERLHTLSQEQPLLANQKLTNESLLIHRIALTIFGTICAYNFLGYPDVYASAVLLAAGTVSLPSLFLGVGSYFLCQGAFSILLTKEMNKIFQNTLIGGAEIAAACTLLYFHDIKPIGLLEPRLQKASLLHAGEQERSICVNSKIHNP